RQAAASADAYVDQAESLILQKRLDAVSAAVGAYLVLRLGQTARLGDWTENLRQWFPWLPDGAAIRGEPLARVGRHAEALAVSVDDFGGIDLSQFLTPPAHVAAISV